jgi:HPt (histidine-containing phosphotransfer) domain-containing protein
MLVERMRDATAAVTMSCAHTLKGSARNIGAWGVATAAERVEQAAADATAAQAAMLQLVLAIEDARRAIAARID